MQYGYEEGDTCGRGFPVACTGVIEDRPAKDCSCHIAAPCHSCTENRCWCPECGYEGKNDFVMNDYVINADSTGSWKAFEPRPLDPTKIDYHTKAHSNCSMIKEGVYPEGTTREEVLEKVKGTFGGRFAHFGNGRFKYIAYTD